MIQRLMSRRRATNRRESKQQSFRVRHQTIYGAGVGQEKEQEEGEELGDEQGEEEVHEGKERKEREKQIKTGQGCASSASYVWAEISESLLETVQHLTVEQPRQTERCHCGQLFNTWLRPL